jgi:hypothetical protein
MQHLIIAIHQDQWTPRLKLTTINKINREMKIGKIIEIIPHAAGIFISTYKTLGYRSGISSNFNRITLA